MVENAVLIEKSIVILGEGESSSSTSNLNITVRTFQVLDAELLCLK